MKISAQRKAGRRKQASHGPLRFVISHSCFPLTSMRNHVKKEAPEEEAGCALIVPAFDGLNLQKFCGPSRETNGSKWWPLDAID